MEAAHFSSQNVAPLYALQESDHHLDRGTESTRWDTLT